MSQTNEENLLAGSTKKAQAGKKLQPVMKHGEEPPAMLLALLNSPLGSMINSQQAKILGSGHFRNGRMGTIIMLYDVLPTDSGVLRSVGSLGDK